jgi:DNA-binding NtrC family response regulator
MDMQVQASVLKVLEEKRFRRLGDVRDRSVDVRLIAATHHDLSIAVREKRFREDLYFRINTIVVRLPPLRERREDIPDLATEMLARVANEMGRGDPTLSESGIRALQEYAWPGNLRELKNVLERSLLLSEGREIRRSDLRFEQSTPSRSADEDGALTLEEMESLHIKRVLADEGGSVERAATRLGITRNTLYYKLRKHRLTAR